MSALITHASITDPDLHEVKGAAAATATHVLTANGDGTATFQAAGGGGGGAYPSINLSFKDKINSKNATYTKKSGFIFPGTGVSGDITATKMIVRVDDAAEPGDVRIWDATNSLVIAELTGETSEDDIIRSLTLTPANFPAAQAIFEIQLRCPSGGDDMNVVSMAMEF